MTSSAILPQTQTPWSPPNCDRALITTWARAASPLSFSSTPYSEKLAPTVQIKLSVSQPRPLGSSSGRTNGLRRHNPLKFTWRPTSARARTLARSHKPCHPCHSLRDHFCRRLRKGERGQRRGEKTNSPYVQPDPAWRRPSNLE